jgi:prophage maintenance system killer protein
MGRPKSIASLAKSAGIDPYELALALIERGVEVDDPEKEIDAATWRTGRAVVRQLRGARVQVRALRAEQTVGFLEPTQRSPALLGMLSVEDVLFIHDRLCEDFAATDDPIDPPGVRNMSLLASAVSRQEVGYEEELKYHEPVLNAATLLYGICNDHPFHNGNKRTALVSALAHLDRNRLVLAAGTKQDDLFRLMIAVATHSVLRRRVKIGRTVEEIPRRGTPDEEVAAIATWLDQRVEKITRGERPITYRELRLILQCFGFVVYPLKNQKAAVCRPDARARLMRRSPKTLMSIGWPGDGRQVSIGRIKDVRSTLKLGEEDGVTSDTFYSRGVRVDAFINEYRVVLRRLASR